MKRSLLIGLVLCLAGPACTRPQPAAVQTQPPITQPLAASPSPSPEVPVQLAGIVNNMGVKDFSGVGTNIAVEFQLKNFSFTATFVKTLPGANVNIQLDNLGQVEHTFTIDSLKVDHKLAPGGQIEGQFKLPDSGVIPFYCRFHVGQGMQGAFYFEEGGSAVAATPSPTSDDSAGASYSGTKKSASSARRTASSAKAPASTAQNKAGDLVIPDLVIGEAQAGKSTATTLPKALPKASPRSSPGTSATSKTAPKKAASGTAGEPSEPGTAGEEGEEGTPGEDGDTDSSLND